MANKIIPKKIIKDILIVAVGVLAIWIGLQAAFGTQNPFYVVASGSMVPVLEVYDVLVVQGHDPFKEIEIGDISNPTGHISATGGGLYKVAVKQCRFQIDAAKEDRWTFAMQFVAKSRNDIVF